MRCPSCRAENPDGMKFCGNCGSPLRGVVAEPKAELRQLTVLFCDLAGSTALSDTLDPEDLRDVMAGYHAACDDAIRRHEGHVAQYLGDGVLVYFGYPVAHEDAARRAVGAGLHMVAAVAELSDRLSRKRGITLAVRVGVHTGPVVVGDVGGGERREQLAQGKTPNVAARLQNLATPGSVVISDDTYRIVSGFFECTALGKHELKGLAAGVTLYLVERESGAETRLDVARRTGLSPLTGRDRERATLEECWHGVTSGGGHAVLVEGEAGIGKSRLVETVRARAEAEGGTVFESQCTPYSQNAALFPVIGVLERSLGFRRDLTDADRRQALRSRLEQRGVASDEALALMSALLGIPVEGIDPTAAYVPQRRRERTLDILLEWLLATAREAPVLWVVEDLHWADPTTLEFISSMVQAIAGARTLVVLTFRPDFSAPWPPGPTVSTLSLARLARAETAALAARVAGNKALPDEVLSQLVARTEGVPLFIEEITKAVLELNVLEEQEDRYELAGALPPDLIPSTIQDSLNARLDRLGPAKATAQLAATIGREFRFDLLSAVATEGTETLRTDLDRLVQAELVYPSEEETDETYLFKHALVQDAAYQSLLKKTRRELHGRIATALRDRFGDVASARPELVAEHFTAAEQPEPATQYWGMAGQLALGRAAYHEAVAHLRHGLRLVPDLPEALRETRQLELMFGLIPALISTQGWASHELGELYPQMQALVEKGNSPYRFIVASGTLGYNLTGGRIAIALKLCEQVLTLANEQGDAPSRAIAHQNYSATALYHGDFQLTLDHANAGLALYDPQVEAVITQLIGLSSFVAFPCYVAPAQWMLGHFDEAMAASRDAVAFARRQGHPHSMGCAYGYLSLTDFLFGDPQVSLASADEAIRHALEERLAFWVTPARILRGWALSRLGNLQEGVREVREALTHFLASGNGVSGLLFRAIYVEVLLAAGDRATAHTTLDEAHAHAETDDERMFESELYRLRAEILLSDVDATRPVASEAARLLTTADDAARRALAIARAQQALPLELRALITLWRVGQARHTPPDDVRAQLAACYGRFPEGFALPELAAARDLLAAP